MLSIELICVGKLKEDYLKEAICEYTKRLSKYCRLTITQLPDEKLPTKLNETIQEEIKQKECACIRSTYQKGFLCYLFGFNRQILFF